jgi:hypothetical protein
VGGKRLSQQACCLFGKAAPVAQRASSAWHVLPAADGESKGWTQHLLVHVDFDTISGGRYMVK